MSGKRVGNIYYMEHIQCLIIGGGPAGYTAAIYASRAGLVPVLYEGLQPGGQLTTTTDIENFPGFENGIDGQGLMDTMRAQARRLGADIRTGTVTSADLSSKPYRFVVDGETGLEADAVIIATGATAKYLGLPSEEKFKGMGVSACATCDGFFYRKKTVAVVGGGDTACEEATYLASLCTKVYMIVRRDVLRASEAMQEKVPPEYLGRVFGLYGAIMSWAMPAGLAVSSLFADAVGAPAWFAGAGAAMVALAVVTWLIPSIRNIERG